MEQKQPPYIGDYVTSRIGKVWTAEDAEEVMRQWERVNEFAMELVTQAKKAV